tara:strand:- start:4 stop:147 length:144 start_codon:yes stop_codon:yes gene_type:complete
MKKFLGLILIVIGIAFGLAAATGASSTYAALVMAVMIFWAGMSLLSA